MKQVSIVYVQETLDMLKAHLTFYNHTWAEQDEYQFNTAIAILNDEAEKNSRKGRRKIERPE